VIINDLEAKTSFDLSQRNADIAYVMQSYFTIPDSTVTVTNKEIQDYYNAHKASFAWKHRWSNYRILPKR